MLMPLAPLAVAIVLAATAPPVSIDMPIGQKEDAVVAALSAAHVAVRREPMPGGARLTYSRGPDAVTVELAAWPAPGSPASAWQNPVRANGPLTVVHVRVAGPNGAAKKQLGRTLERGGEKWKLVPESAQANRSAADRQKYGRAAYLQWWDKPEASRGTGAGAHARAPSVTLLFQAQRPADKPAGTEPTIIDAYLENPWHPRRF